MKKKQIQKHALDKYDCHTTCDRHCHTLLIHFYANMTKQL